MHDKLAFLASGPRYHQGLIHSEPHKIGAEIRQTLKDVQNHLTSSSLSTNQSDILCHHVSSLLSSQFGSRWHFGSVNYEGPCSLQYEVQFQVWSEESSRPFLEPLT